MVDFIVTAAAACYRHRNGTIVIVDNKSEIRRRLNLKKWSCVLHTHIQDGFAKSKIMREVCDLYCMRSKTMWMWLCCRVLLIACYTFSSANKFLGNSFCQQDATIGITPINVWEIVVCGLCAFSFLTLFFLVCHTCVFACSVWLSNGRYTYTFSIVNRGKVDF